MVPLHGSFRHFSLVTASGLVSPVLFLSSQEWGRRSKRRPLCDEDHIRFGCELQRLGSSRVKLPTSLEVFAQITSIFCTNARKSCVFLIFLLHSPSKRVAYLIALSNIHLSNSPDLFCLGPRTKGQSREDGQSRTKRFAWKRLSRCFGSNGVQPGW